MTLILCTEPNTNPLLFADSLLSTKSGDSKLNLPTIGTAHTKLLSEVGTRPYTGGKKIIQINTTMMVAYAGNVVEAQKIIVGMISVFKDSKPDDKYINAYLRANFEPTITSRAVSLMVVLRENGKTSFLQFNCRQIILPGLGLCYAAGTGSETLADIAKSAQVQLSESLALGKPRGATMCALYLAGIMLGAEITTGTTLARGFGIYYELADCSNETFSFITDTCFVFWDFPSTDDRLPMAVKIIKRMPSQEPVEFFAADLPPSGSGPLTNEKNYRITSGLEANLLPATHGRPNLNSCFQVNVFMATNPRGRAVSITKVEFADPPTNHLISFTGSGDKIEFRIYREILQRIMKDLRPMIQSSK